MGERERGRDRERERERQRETEWERGRGGERQTEGETERERERFWGRKVYRYIYKSMDTSINLSSRLFITQFALFLHEILPNNVRLSNEHLKP